MIGERGRELGAEAAGAIQIGIRRLAHGHPFHAALIATFRISANGAIKTVGVTIRANEVHLIYNPEFVAKCSLPELEGVLHHELNHVIFGHLLIEPADYPDDDALVIATEVTANEFVPESLPGRPILLAQFPNLPADEGTDERYRRLAWPEVRRRARQSSSGQRDSAHEGPDLVRSGPKTVPPGPNSGTLQPLDDHTLWDEARACGELGRLVVRESVRAARDTLTTDQIDALPAGIREAAAIAAGDRPGQAVELVGKGKSQAKLDWRVLLRRYIHRELAIRPSFNRPPRRFPSLVGVVPGHAHRQSLKKPVVMTVLDTSASMDASTIEAIGTELIALRRHYRVTVVECDVEVHATYELTGPLAIVHGRGGTDLRPPFEQEILGTVRPDVIIYFTDGCGPAPSRAPSVPVIWCLTPDGQQPTWWGRTVHLSDCDEQ